MKESKYIILGLALYLIPILLFGDFRNVYQWILLPITIFILYWRMKSKDRKFDSYINGALLGLFLGMYGLNTFSMQINKSIIDISFTYSNILGYWVSFLSYFLLHSIYRHKIKEKQLKEFDYDWTKIEREQKIDAILNKW